jgi:chloramphenicol O-acetyltransferase
MARFLDLESWPRRQTFEYFRGYDKPYFNICASLEAGPLVELVRSEPEVSFFLAYLYLSLRAANESEPFRYRLSEGRVLVHERIHAGTTSCSTTRASASPISTTPRASPVSRPRRVRPWLSSGRARISIRRISGPT